MIKLMSGLALLAVVNASEGPPPQGEGSRELTRAAPEVIDDLARVTPGAIRELNVRPAGPHTEIAARAAGTPSYRLFQRLSDPIDPRLTMVLTGASYAIVEKSFSSIERGGVRAIEVTELGIDTVQIAVGLQERTAFTIFRRGDEVILRIENPDGEFSPWSSRPLALASAESEIDDDAQATSEEGAELDAVILASPAGRTSGGPPSSGIGKIDSVTGPTAIGLLLLIGTTTIITWRRVRREGRRRGEPEAGDRGSSRETASRIWAARILAESGVSADEIARQTGLARDAVHLITPRPIERPKPAEAAAPGTFFRGYDTLAGLGQVGGGLAK